MSVKINVRYFSVRRIFQLTVVKAVVYVIVFLKKYGHKQNLNLWILALIYFKKFLKNIIGFV